MNSLTNLLRKLNAISEQQVNEEQCDECGMDPCSCDHVDESAKPDYADLDKDGDEEESMKKAAKDKEELDECGMPMAAEMSPMSSVGDTSPMAAVIAPGIAADQMGTEPEAAMEPVMEPEPSVEEKASYSLSIRNGDSTLTMTTDAPDEIIHVMKLAGVKGKAEVKKVEPEGEEQGQEEVEEAWGNTPAATNEKEPKAYGDIRDWGMKGTAKADTHYTPAKQGDNPMNETAMFEEYKKFKAGK